MPAVEEYRFVEVAIGGKNRRNRVVSLEELGSLITSTNGTPDILASLLRYTDDFARYTETHPSPSTGKPPSVADYDGPSLATCLPFDFDSKDDPAKALEDVRTLARRVHALYGVAATALRCFFSGSKGFHVEIPASLFGDFEPGTDTHERLRRGARALAGDLRTIDFDIYTRVRLWRISGTKHGATGLYKIPLTTEELLSLDLEAIRDLAKAPRAIDLPPDDDWQPIPELVALWRETAKPTEEPRKTGSSKPRGEFRPAKLKPILDGCAWLRHAREHAATLPEPEWYNMLGIVGRCEGGETTAHDWSRPHPKYTERETTAKLEHALRDAGPATCERIRARGGEPYCSTCPAWTIISSPIRLGTTKAIGIDDFYAYMPQHNYICAPTR